MSLRLPIVRFYFCAIAVFLTAIVLTVTCAAATPVCSDDSPQESPKLPVTELFKRVLEEQRRLREAQAEATAPKAGLPESQVNQDSPGENSSGLARLQQSASENDDPVRREMARKFLRLKTQLLHLRSRLQTSESGVLTEDDRNSDAESAVDHIELLPAEDAHNDGSFVKNHDSSESPKKRQHESWHARPTADHPSESVGHESQPTAAMPSDSPSRPATNNADGPSDNGDESDTEENDGQGAQPSFLNQAVVDGPIDRIGLANNLFAVGEYRLAMDMYEHTDSAEMSAEQQIWAEYQTANCLRRLGRLGEASNRYRKLAGQPEAGWFCEQSQWWVNVLERVRQLRQSFDETAEEVVLLNSASPPSDAAGHHEMPSGSKSGRGLHSAIKSKEPEHGAHSL